MGHDTFGFCAVCLVEHDEEIHAATLDVLGWFKDQVTQGFELYEDAVLDEQPLFAVSA